VPVVLVLTKFDMVISQVLRDSFSDAPQHYERARESARKKCEESCRPISHKEIVSGIDPFLPVLLEGSTDILDRSQWKQVSAISLRI
jgi:hypothetical protein